MDMKPLNLMSVDGFTFWASTVLFRRCSPMSWSCFPCFFKASFRVSAVRSFVHLDFIVSEVRSGHSVLPAPFTEEVVFFPMHIFGNAIKNQLAAMGSWVCVWAVYSISLFYSSVLWFHFSSWLILLCVNVLCFLCLFIYCGTTRLFLIYSYYE